MSTQLGVVCLSDGRDEQQEVSLTRFFGGQDRGVMIQLTFTSTRFIQASPEEMKKALMDLADMIEIIPVEDLAGDLISG